MTEQLPFANDWEGTTTRVPIVVGEPTWVFPDPSARRTDPDTSHAAAEDAKRNANTLRWRCLQVLKAHPEGLTDFALADEVQSQQTSAGKRRGELVKAGLVEKATVDGVVVKRPSPSGSAAIVWRYIRR